MQFSVIFGIFLTLRPIFSNPIAQVEATKKDLAADSVSSRSKRQSDNRAVPKEYNRKLYQGDIVLSNDPNNIQREATLREMTWPNGIVPYTIEISDSDAASMIEDAMREFAAKTCVKFIPKTDNDEYFIRIQANDGCSSTVGRSTFARNGQEVSLSDGCYNPGTIRHELMHVLGFFHEQSRTDRDDYVKIIWENIQSGLEDQFAKNNAREVTDLGSPYDYGSLMHYSYSAFARDESLPTMTKIDGSTSGFGQRKGFSDIDLLEINKLYNCPNAGNGGRRRPNGFGGGGVEATTFEPEATTDNFWGQRPPHNHRGGFRGNNGWNGGWGGFGNSGGEGTGENGGNFRNRGGGFGFRGNNGWNGGWGGFGNSGGVGTGENGGNFHNRGGGFGFRRNNGGPGAIGGETMTGGGHETEGSGSSWFDRWVAEAKEKASSFFG